MDNEQRLWDQAGAMWTACCLARLGGGGGGVGKFCCCLPPEGSGWLHCGGGGRGWRKWPGSLSCPEEKAQKLGSFGGEVPEESSAPLRLHSENLLP